MRITLQPRRQFWGLMNPVSLKPTLTLTEEKPVSAEIDATKLFKWEIEQILASVKAKSITISGVQIEDLLKSLPVKEVKPEKKAPSRKQASQLKV